MISGRVLEYVGVVSWKGGVPKECGWFVALCRKCSRRCTKGVKLR